MVQSLAVSNDRFYATGKRKSSIARVWLKAGSGSILVNGKKYNEYFKRPVLQLSIEKPFNVIAENNAYDVMCTVKGGGLTGQAGAVSRSEEHTSELQSLRRISYAVFCLDRKSVV